MTKTNVGIDIDGKPPTAEISIARREAVLEPTFEGGQVPPVMASFRSAATGLLGLFYDISATFAGGDAATTMAKLYGDPTAEPEDFDTSSMCLWAPPKGIPIFPSATEGSEQDSPYRYFAFGTDTAFGLKIAWSGMTAQFPDTVRLGYNRKELAWAPIFVSKEECTEPITNTKRPYKVTVNSFLATIDHDGQATTLKDTGFDHLQYFATGKAATSLSLRKEVRDAMIRKIAPDAPPGIEYSPDSNSKCITDWVNADRAANLPALRNWIDSQNINARPTDFVIGKNHAANRGAAVSALSIPCP
jgi:hypothetical protein